MKKCYVYVIMCNEGYVYKGITEDLEVRMMQHNEGTLSFWTKRGKDWQLIYSEEFDNKQEALRREKWLKTGARRDYLKRILNSK